MKKQYEINQLEKEMLEFIEKNKGVSCVELENKFGNGDSTIAFSTTNLAKYNIYMWFNFSENVCIALGNLYREQKLEIDLVDIWVYLHDGMIPKVSVAKNIRKYKTDRWLPVVFNVKS